MLISDQVLVSLAITSEKHIQYTLIKKQNKTDLKIRLNIVIILIFSLLVSSCMTTSELSKRQLKHLDKSLVGTWVGSETGVQYNDTKREWEMIRNQNGTYIINFKTHYPDYTSESTEEGYWWTKQGVFYEHCTSHKTDVYDYNVVSENIIEFKTIKIQTSFVRDNYVFTDKRKEN